MLSTLLSSTSNEARALFIFIFPPSLSSSCSTYYILSLRADMGVIFKNVLPSAFEPIVLEKSNADPDKLIRLSTPRVANASSTPSSTTNTSTFPLLRLPLEIRAMIYRHLVVPSNFLFLSSASYTEIDSNTWPRTALHTRKSDFLAARDHWFNLPDAQRNPFYGSERKVCWSLLLVNKQIHEEASEVLRSEAELCIDCDARFIKMLDTAHHPLRSRKRKAYLIDAPTETQTPLFRTHTATPVPQASRKSSSSSSNLIAYLSKFRHITLHIAYNLTAKDLFHLSPLTISLRNARHPKLQVTIVTTRAYNPYEDRAPPSAKSKGIRRMLAALKTIHRDIGGSTPQSPTLTLRIIDLRPVVPWQFDLDGMDTVTVADWQSQIQEVVDEVTMHGKGVFAESWCPNRGPRKTWDEYYYALGYKQQQSLYPRRIGTQGDAIEEEGDDGSLPDLSDSVSSHRRSSPLITSPITMRWSSVTPGQ